MHHSYPLYEQNEERESCIINDVDKVLRTEGRMKFELDPRKICSFLSAAEKAIIPSCHARVTLSKATFMALAFSTGFGSMPLMKNIRTFWELDRDGSGVQPLEVAKNESRTI